MEASMIEKQKLATVGLRHKKAAWLLYPKPPFLNF
jgi:hypothetical protein